jgi:hypothetical protein
MNQQKKVIILRALIILNIYTYEYSELKDKKKTSPIQPKSDLITIFLAEIKCNVENLLSKLTRVQYLEQLDLKE